MKKLFLILSAALIVGCSTISLSYDPVEYDRMVEISMTSEDVLKSCGDKVALEKSVKRLDMQITHMYKHSKFIHHNTELHEIVSRLNKGSSDFSKLVQKGPVNLDFCKLQGEFFISSTERTLEAIGKRR